MREDAQILHSRVAFHKLRESRQPRVYLPSQHEFDHASGCLNQVLDQLQTPPITDQAEPAHSQRLVDSGIPTLLRPLGVRRQVPPGESKLRVELVLDNDDGRIGLQPVSDVPLVLPGREHQQSAAGRHRLLSHAKKPGLQALAHADRMDVGHVAHEGPAQQQACEHHGQGDLRAAVDDDKVAAPEQPPEPRQRTQQSQAPTQHRPVSDGAENAELPAR